jgi:uncharacterized repeat protein (TIGR01451 family)
MVAVTVLIVLAMAAPGAAGSGTADLQLTTTAEPGQAVAGETITWTVRVTNLGPDDATGVELIDVVGEWLQITGVPSICAIDAAGSSAECDVGEVMVGETTLLMIVTDASAGPSTYENEATVSADTTDPESANDVSRMTVEAADSGGYTDPEPTPEPADPEPTDTDPAQLPATGRYSLPLTFTGARLLALGAVLSILAHQRQQIVGLVGWRHRPAARRRGLRWW